MKKKEKEKLKKISSITNNENTNNDGPLEKFPILLELNKEIISILNSGSSDKNPAGQIRLSIFTWVDCGGGHSPHWCNTKCVTVKSSLVDPTDRPECGKPETMWDPKL